MFCFSSFDGTLSLKCRIHSTTEKPEAKQGSCQGLGTGFQLLVSISALMSVLAFSDMVLYRGSNERMK